MFNIKAYKVKSFLKHKMGEGVYECLRKLKRTFPFLVYPGLYKKTAAEFKKVYRKDTIFYVGTPPHGNIGDSAIAVATLQFFEKAGFKNIYEVPCPDYYLVKRLMKKYGKNNLICFHGGGNMGELYFSNEVMRRDIIRSFPNNTIILFPQTIDYSNTEKGRKELQKSIEIYSKHKKLHIFAREQVSYDRMKKYYSANHVYLVPDIVLSWKLDFDADTEREDVLFCLRKDVESKFGMEKRQQIYDVCKSYFPNIIETDTWIPKGINTENRDKLVIGKIQEFRKSKLVITDRLHGMIFAAISGTPCIVFPNSNHKTISEYEWLKELEFIRLLPDSEKLEETIEYFVNQVCPNSYEAFCADKEFAVLLDKLYYCEE